MDSHFEFKQAKTARGRPRGYYFVLKAANGEIVLTSEIYTTKANAERGAATIARVVGEMKGVRVPRPTDAPTWEETNGGGG